MEQKSYDSDETIVSEDELTKLEITPKRDQPQIKMVESASQVTPNSSQIENGTPETPKQNKAKKMMESSSQVTPGLSQLVTRGQGTSEQLQTKQMIESSSQVTPGLSQLESRLISTPEVQNVEISESSFQESISNSIFLDKIFFLIEKKMTPSEKQVFKKSVSQNQTPFQAPKPSKRRMKTPHHSKVQLSQNAASDEILPRIAKTKKVRWRYLQTNDPKRYGKYKLILNFGKYADNEPTDSELQPPENIVNRLPYRLKRRRISPVNNSRPRKQA
ncbi:unnamed protein product [Oikopleura dioica]|uniref:Uncharacterized protein n=1 Tax=Oikopleura dioica TaxID=34765 RepID=E4YW73_OIKDI|nr:unnamed protein product [Oikopleura dioica]